MQHAEGSFIADDGWGIFWQSWLPDDSPRAVVMLIHGLAEHSGRYQYVAERLVDAGYGVYALDHRGHGRSGGKRVYVKSCGELLGDLAAFRSLIQDRHPGAQFVVLGHSMGGNLAVGHALEAPVGITALAVSGPALRVGDAIPAAQLTVLQMLGRVAPGVRPQALSADAVSRDPAVVQAYRDDPLVYSGKVTAGLLAALIGSMSTFPGRYATLTMPIWIGHGTEDRLTDIEGSRRLESEAVNADVTAHYYEGLYHEIFNEPERDQVIADLVSWLDRVVA
jgi:alpha-beta hydrolase superfamily lysophospholipase